MTTYLASAIPNAWLPSNSQTSLVIQSISVNEVVEEIFEYDHYESYSDNIAPAKLKKGVISCVGHQEMANKISHQVWERCDAYDDYGNPIKPIIPVSRMEVSPKRGDMVIAILNVIANPRSNSRLSQKEFEQMDIPTKWVKCTFE